jgi:hypothetical protein
MKLYTLLFLLLAIGCSHHATEPFVLIPDEGMLTKKPLIEGQSAETAYQSSLQDAYRPAQSHTVYLPDGETIDLHCI